MLWAASPIDPTTVSRLVARRRRPGMTSFRPAADGTKRFHRRVHVFASGAASARGRAAGGHVTVSGDDRTRFG